MARKSSDLDKKMVAAGIELIQEGGIARLSTREIADRAGANLGMFNYHFGTKEKFILKILNDFYQKFLDDLMGLNGEDPELEAVLHQIAAFSRDNRKLLTPILSDVLVGDKVVIRFLKKNFSKHFLVLELALQKHLKLKNLLASNPHHAIRFLIGAVGVPNILLEISEKGSRYKYSPESDEELVSRVKAAIIGLESKLCISEMLS
ncbi:MAG: TetR/AcrR family transcriptional regulator [Oligoflexia bacterium]|nr:TetR/AcrR family transcriptional regulator [Oligoflexia bacterium]